MAGSEPVLTSVLGNVFRIRTVRNIRTNTKHKPTLEAEHPQNPVLPPLVLGSSFVNEFYINIFTD